MEDFMDHEKKKNRMTVTQKEFLVAYMAEHPQLVTKKFTSTFTFAKGEKLWEHCIEKLNGMGPPKNKAEWKKSWRALRQSAKQAASEIKKSYIKTGGGSGDEDELSPTKTQNVSLSGGKIVIDGDSKCAVFPKLSEIDSEKMNQESAEFGAIIEEQTKTIAAQTQAINAQTEAIKAQTVALHRFVDSINTQTSINNEKNNAIVTVMETLIATIRATQSEK